MKYIDRVCQHCGKIFSAPSKEENRKFCSLDCFHASRRAPGRRCVVCGKKIDPRRGKTVRCCSHSCAGVLKIREGKVRQKAPPRMEERICRHCGKTFTVKRSSNRTLCSEKCRGENYKQTQEKRRDKELHTCALCGREFETYRKQQIYCSAVCSQKAQEREPGSERMVDIRITTHIPVYEHLRPKVGHVYRAEDHRIYGCAIFIVPDICGKRIVVREAECEVVGE